MIFFNRTSDTDTTDACGGGCVWGEWKAHKFHYGVRAYGGEGMYRINRSQIRYCQAENCRESQTRMGHAGTVDMEEIPDNPGTERVIAEYLLSDDE